MRDWLKNMDPIDRDCVYRYEYLLGRKLTGPAEYSELDRQVDELILEYDSRTAFFHDYPALAHYRAPSLASQIQTASSKAQKKDAHTSVPSQTKNLSR